MFEGFELRSASVAAQVCVRFRVGGAGPAVVLLHGHPRTHTTWHKVAPRLVSGGLTVVCPDLRGYGQSCAPPPHDDHAQASKRAMAQDVVSLMDQLGHDRFAVVGHDRGSYVAYRLALDHPDRVTGLVVLDSVPIAEALARADARFAQAWWHWFFLAQPETPERIINADPDAWYGAGADLQARMGDDNYADYLTAIHDPNVVLAMIEDYRAGLGPDRAADEADRAAGHTISCPTTVAWSTLDDMETLYGDPLQVWRPWTTTLAGRSIHSGHHMAEQVPNELADLLLEALSPSTDQ